MTGKIFLEKIEKDILNWGSFSKWWTKVLRHADKISCRLEKLCKTFFHKIFIFFINHNSFYILIIQRVSFVEFSENIFFSSSWEILSHSIDDKFILHLLIYLQTTTKLISFRVYVILCSCAFPGRCTLHEEKYSINTGNIKIKRYKYRRTCLYLKDF